MKETILSHETQARIIKDAKKHFPSDDALNFALRSAYIRGANTEAYKAQELVKALELIQGGHCAPSFIAYTVLKGK